MKKPKVLYHASENRNIEIFEPRNLHIRHKVEGPVVFATPSKAVASMFIADADDRWVMSGLHNKIPYMVVSDRKRFEESDKGGAIYHLPSNNFECNMELGLRDNEWTSKVPVKPLLKEEYSSALQAMLELGAQVYFVDNQTFSQLKISSDHGFAQLQTLQSENQRLNINYRPFVTFE